MYRILFVIALTLSANLVFAQEASWFLGVWKGAALTRKRSDDSKLQRIFDITSVSGNSFEGIVKITLLSDTSVRYDSKVSGTISHNYLTATLGDNIYKKDPPGAKWETRCNTCGPIIFLFAIHDGKFFITGETRGCATPCNGISVYSRDTSDFDPHVWASLDTLVNNQKNIAKQEQVIPQKSPDTTSAAKVITPPPTVKVVAKNDTPVVKQHEIAANKKTTQQEPVVQTAKPKDTVSFVKAPVLTKPVEVFEDRPKTFVQTFPVSTDSVTLELFDNGIVDGDTASVFFNDSVVVDRHGLTTHAFTVKVAVNKTKDNTIVLYAHNLGSIPPNTALLEIYSGSKMYSLTLSSDLQMSSGIILKYQKE